MSAEEPTVVQIGGVTARAYEYAEDNLEGHTVISAKLRVSAFDNEDFKGIISRQGTDSYFDVQVEESENFAEPVEMRHGMIHWSLDDQNLDYKYDIVLVPRSYDYQRPEGRGEGASDLFMREIDGTRAALADLIGRFENLTATLVEKHVLTEEEVKAITRTDRRQRFDAHLETRKEGDIDDPQKPRD